MKKLAAIALFLASLCGPAQAAESGLDNSLPFAIGVNGGSAGFPSPAASISKSVEWMYAETYARGQLSASH